jgi:hypothetical protein
MSFDLHDTKRLKVYFLFKHSSSNIMEINEIKNPDGNGMANQDQQRDINRMVSNKIANMVGSMKRWPTV